MAIVGSIISAILGYFNSGEVSFYGFKLSGIIDFFKSNILFFKALGYVLAGGAAIGTFVFTKKADLVLGVFSLNKMSHEPSTKIANRFIPMITGQRAIWRQSLPPISVIRDSQYGADLLIARNVPKKRRAVVKLNELSQVTKEKKAGHDFTAAFKARIKMYREVIKVLLEENKH